MNAPIVHRGVEIVRLDVPSTPFIWFNDETEAHGEANTVEQAFAQIDAHLDVQGAP